MEISVEDLEKSEGLSCGCMFHNECIQGMIDSNVKDGKVPIMCPTDGCGREISERDIRINSSNDMIFIKY